MKLRAHANVISLAEKRRAREQQSEPVVQFVDWSTAPAAPSHPTAQALLAGLMQGIGEREKDAAMADAGKRLAEAAQRLGPVGQMGFRPPVRFKLEVAGSSPARSHLQKGRAVAPGWRWRANAIWTWLGLGKRRRTC